MALARFAAKRIAYLLLVLVLFVVFLMLFVNSTGMMNDVMQRQAFREAIQSCQRDEACNTLPFRQRNAEILSRRLEILAQQQAEPFLIRVLRQTWGYLTLDWGIALYHQSRTGSFLVADIVLERIPFTIGLFSTGTLLGAYIGIRTGLKMASKALRPSDRGLTFLSLMTTVIPPWIWGIYFIFIFAITLRLFPSYGYLTVPPPRDPWEYTANFLWHLALPLLTLTFASFGAWAYVTRNLVLPTEREDHVQAARARGVPERTVMKKHVLRVAYPPLVTTLAIALIATLNGIILVEGIFGWPGIGWLYWEALSFGDLETYGPVDTPILVALPVAFAMIFLVVIFILDLTYGYLDPRIRALDRK
ncbi:MAG: ABC transporter permease [Candidatus Thermoplasmatota archaeon]|nr:ABC transporter permease [Candidatus Thermoplasmatota archaeon]